MDFFFLQSLKVPAHSITGFFLSFSDNLTGWASLSTTKYVAGIQATVAKYLKGQELILWRE